MGPIVLHDFQDWPPASLGSVCAYYVRLSRDLTGSNPSTEASGTLPAGRGGRLLMLSGCVVVSGLVISLPFFFCL